MTAPGPDLLRPSAARPGRTWSIALGAALFATLAAWAIEEASLGYYGPQMTAASAPRGYRDDLRLRQANEPGGAVVRGGPNAPRGQSPYGATRARAAYIEEFTTRAVAVSGAAVGAMFGLAMGLASGLSGARSSRSWARGLAVGVLGAAACGAGGWLATWALVPTFYRARIDNPGSPLVLASLLLIRGVPRMIAGLACGLALGVATGGGSPRLARGALGGLIGAAIGVALVVIGDELADVLANHTEIASSPILRSPARRVSAILAVTLPSAACAAWAILSLKAGRADSPVAEPESA